MPYACNVSTKTRTINVTAAPDTQAPVITLNGSNTVNVVQGETYTESGATCVDNKDASRNVVITGTLNTAVVGTYTKTYTATDLAGNVSTKTRTINVTAAPDPAPTSDAIGTITVGDNAGLVFTTGLPSVTDPLSRSVSCVLSGFPSGFSLVGNDSLQIQFDAFGQMSFTGTRSCDAGPTGNKLVQSFTVHLLDEG